MSRLRNWVMGGALALGATFMAYNLDDFLLRGAGYLRTVRQEDKLEQVQTQLQASQAAQAKLKQQYGDLRIRWDQLQTVSGMEDIDGDGQPDDVLGALVDSQEKVGLAAHQLVECLTSTAGLQEALDASRDLADEFERMYIAADVEAQGLGTQLASAQVASGNEQKRRQQAETGLVVCQGDLRDCGSTNSDYEQLVANPSSLLSDYDYNDDGALDTVGDIADNHLLLKGELRLCEDGREDDAKYIKKLLRINDECDAENETLQDQLDICTAETHLATVELPSSLQLPGQNVMDSDGDGRVDYKELLAGAGDLALRLGACLTEKDDLSEQVVLLKSDQLSPVDCNTCTYDSNKGPLTGADAVTALNQANYNNDQLQQEAGKTIQRVVGLEAQVAQLSQRPEVCPTINPTPTSEGPEEPCDYTCPDKLLASIKEARDCLSNTGLLQATITTLRTNIEDAEKAQQALQSQCDAYKLSNSASGTPDSQLASRYQQVEQDLAAAKENAKTKACECDAKIKVYEDRITELTTRTGILQTGSCPPEYLANSPFGRLEKAVRDGNAKAVGFLFDEYLLTESRDGKSVTVKSWDDATRTMVSGHELLQLCGVDQGRYNEVINLGAGLAAQFYHLPRDIPTNASGVRIFINNTNH